MGAIVTKTEQERLEYQVRDAHAAARRGDLDDAETLINEVRRALAHSGLESAYATWLAATIADGLDKHSEAMDLVDVACRLDPASPSARNSRRIIFARGREALHLALRRGDTNGAGRLHEALLRGGEADRAVSSN
jgi:hypothetical protein